MSAAVNADLRRRLDVGPFPRGGYGGTVHNTGGGDNQTSGASFMIIADTANWDNSVGLNTPGQAGDPDSPHYRDLFEVWARGPLLPDLLLAREDRLGDRVDDRADDRATGRFDGRRLRSPAAGRGFQ